VLGSQAGPIGEVAGYISEAYKTVEHKTGVQFGANFLDGTLKEGKVLFDSFPPAKALRIFKEFKPLEMVEFAADVQESIYYDGIDPSDIDRYIELVERYGVSARDFRILWGSSDYDVRTREEFIFARQLDVSGYPSVFFENGNHYHKIASGYTPFSILKGRLEQLIEQAKLQY